MDTFTIGEQVVQIIHPFLPVLTIEKVNENGTYHCSYHDEKHVDHTGDFKAEELMKYVNPATIYRL
jgi:uncharacterized protein YodC (DUF2158 family)